MRNCYASIRYVTQNHKLLRFMVVSMRAGRIEQGYKQFSAPRVVCFHLVLFFGEASMGVTSDQNPAMSALPPKADIRPMQTEFLLCAIGRHCANHSITSSAMESSPDGTSMPRARAV
jgi:hypothetical protein